MTGEIRRISPLDDYNYLSLFDYTADLAREIAIRKNLEYGSSFSRHFSIGCMIRVLDKLDRHLNVDSKKLDLAGEKIEDDLIDCVNYLVYAYFLLHHDKLPIDNATFISLYDNTMSVVRDDGIVNNKDYGSEYAKYGIVKTIKHLSDVLDVTLSKSNRKIEFVTDQPIEMLLVRAINMLIYAYFLIKFRHQIEVI